ncbi:flippase [Vibrio artabrorum]|uniref:flippase n=1 Tax=Vibrio artabrorum TaxID=446374 RepID=UPI00354C2DAF
MNGTIKKYLFNTSWLLLEKLFRMIIGLLVVVWVTRYLGPEQFGVFSYSQSFVAIFTVVASLGLDAIVVKELVQKNYDKEDVLGTSFILKLAASIFVISFSIITAYALNSYSETLLYIAIISLGIIFSSFNVIDFYFQSEVKSKYVVFSNITVILVSSIVKICCILLEKPLIYFVLISLLDSMLFVFLLLNFYIRKKATNIKKWKFNKALAKLMLIQSTPLVIAGIVNSMQMKIDTLMISHYLGSIQVGYYSAAVKLSEVWFGVGVVICNSLFPAIIKAKNISKESYDHKMIKLYQWLTAGALIVSVVVYFISDNIIYILYGSEFTSASSVLSIHIFSSIFVFMGVASGRWLVNEHLTKISFYRNIIALIVNLILNIVLIQTVGIEGAAIASLISYIVGFYLFDILIVKTRHMFYMKSRALLFLGFIPK